MLLSPGNSPRHISVSPSLSTDNSSTAELLTLESSAIVHNQRKRRATVLDEDTYVESIEKIIERDFFPDIPKLRDRLDWLEATRSGDPILIRDAQLKILERRAAAAAAISKTPGSIAATDCRTRSPFFSATPFGSDKTPSVAPSASDLGFKEENPSSIVDTTISLDEFCGRYTSEDNESFSKIIDKVNRKRREKYAHLIQGEIEEPAKTIEEERRDRITDGYGTSGQPLATLDWCNYTAKNLLMYNPVDRGEVPLTKEEREERLNGLTKEIDKANTRFYGKSTANSKPTKEEEAAAFLYTPVRGTTPTGASWPFNDRQAEKMKKYDLEELRKTPNPFFVESAKKSENGYSFVKTPSPAPGVDESPFMTWGGIDGTPLRLDLEQPLVGIVGSSDGPHFSIPFPPSRDVKAHSLSREATRRLRERSNMHQKPPLPSPSRNGSSSPFVRNLSPAAQKFVRNAIGKSSSSVDETLRASYRGGSPISSSPKQRSLSRFSRDDSLAQRSLPTRPNSSSPW